MGNNFSATTFTPYFLPPLGFNYGNTPSATETMTEEERITKERKEEAERIRKRVEERVKAYELQILKDSQNSTLKYFNDLQIQSEKSLKQINGSKNKDGSARIDNGEKGWKRWLANAGTSLVNIGKGIAGFDKDGNWDAKTFGLNCLGIAVGIGLCFIPGGAFALGALGAVGAIAGGCKAWNDLEEAEKKKNQAQIDAAQQDVCGNAIIGVLSVFGLKAAGSAFRTSAATASKASCAVQRTGLAGKTVEGVSNFGRDITVNAFKASLKPSANGIVPSSFKKSNWESRYNRKLNNYENTLNEKLQAIDDLIYTTTDNQKLALLLEQKNLLLKNSVEFGKFKTLKAKTDIDKMVAGSTKTSGQANIERLGNYSVSSNKVKINGQDIAAKDFIKFKTQMVNLQKAYDKGLRDLVKARENMMRELALNPQANRAVLDEYIAGLDVKHRWWVPKDKHIWHPLTEDFMTIGGKQPSYLCKSIYTPLIHPASNVPKGLTLWNNPTHSGAMLFTMDMTAEEVQNQVASLTQSIETFKTLREKFANAKTKEEVETVINECNQVLASIQGTQEIAQA